MKQKLLEGIRVLDCSSFAVGPWAGSLFGALGAEVIKIEQPLSDPLRNVMPRKKGEPTTSTVVNYNKRSITLDLKNTDDRKIAIKLASMSDIFIENYKTGIIEKLGLSYEVLKGVNERIIYCSSSSYGKNGPMKNVGSTDPQGQAFGGFASLNGQTGKFAEVWRNISHIDLSTSMVIVSAILSALYRREKTGKGIKIETSQMHSTISLLTSRAHEYFATGNPPRPMGSATSLIVPSQAFQGRDKNWFNVSVINDEQWRGLCKSINRLELANDPQFNNNENRVKNRDSLIGILKEIFLSKESNRWLQLLEENQVPCGIYLNNNDHLYHQHIIENKFFQDMPLGKELTLKTGTYPWRFDNHELSIKTAPQPNEHKEEILEELSENSWL